MLAILWDFYYQTDSSEIVHSFLSMLKTDYLINVESGSSQHDASDLIIVLLWKRQQMIC